MASLAYIICTSPRTGSTLLTDALTGTGIAGCPDEYFDIHEHNEVYWKQKLGISGEASYLDRVVAAATTFNGVFGMKLHWHQWPAFYPKLAGSFGNQSDACTTDEAPRLLHDKFGTVKYLWLRRRNKVAQGISYYRAVNSGVWRDRPRKNGPGKPSEAATEFDFEKIDTFVADAQKMEDGWRDFFRRHRLSPLVLVYEEFVKTYTPTIRGTLAHLGLAADGVPIIEPRLARQADALSLDWEARYRATKSAKARTQLPVVCSPGHTNVASGAGGALTADPIRGAPRPLRQASLSYFICTKPRSGSTLLGDALASTGLAGSPDEFFGMRRSHDEEYWLRRFGARGADEYIDKVIDATTTPNGIFGAKLHWHQCEALHKKLVAGLDSQMPDATVREFEELLRTKFNSPRYIWLRRKNKVAQGISYYRASRTGVWRSVKGRSDQGNVPDQGLDFDFGEIARCVELMRDFDWRWDDYFRRNRLTPLMIFYEDLAENYEVTVRGTLKFLGAPYESVTIAAPKIGRQADDRSQEWERLFLTIQSERRETVSSASNQGAAPSVRGVGVRAREERRVRSNADGALEAERGPNGKQDEIAGLPLIAYETANARAPLIVAPVGRDWMDSIPGRFVYRCLPMLIANQSGWFILNTHKIAVTWDGGVGLDALKIGFLGGAGPRCAQSHFGSGILTFTVPYLFRTPPGFNLHVRGPANMPKDGIVALEGVVETDWSEATFTMNWKMTRPNHTVVFEEGEPIAMFTPVRRRELERFEPEIRPLAENAELAAGYRQWSKSRAKFNADLKEPQSVAREQGWQRDYMRGATVTRQRAPEHQTGLRLSKFARKVTRASTSIVEG